MGGDDNDDVDEKELAKDDGGPVFVGQLLQMDVPINSSCTSDPVTLLRCCFDPLSSAEMLLRRAVNKLI